jgi:PAS domain S-box-containing protein/diguanylate cyclase (GGDEF)-like protein
MSAARARLALATRGPLESAEDVFRSLAAHTPVGLFISDAKGRCVYVNNRWCELTGFSREQALGDGWVAALHPEDAPRVRAEWEDASQAGRSSVVEYRFRRPDGSVRWIEGFASPVRDEQGRVTGWVGTCLDLTARREAEEAVLQASGRFREAFDHAPIGVAVLTPEGRWSQVNRELTRLLGYSEEELVQMTFADVTHPDDIANSLERKRRQLEGDGDELRIEKRYVRRDGEVVWASVSSTLVRDGSGRPLYSVAVIEDISERIRARDAVREAEERFRHAFDDAPIGMALVEPGGRFLRVNRTLSEITGYDEPDLLERTFQDITHPDDLAADVDQMESVLRGEIRGYRMEKRYLRSDGSPVWVMLSVSLIRGPDGAPLHFVSQVEDISDRKRQEAELERMANYDPLTGLGNRRKLMADLERLLREPASEPLGLAIFDLNGFKTYNDLFGHPAGDTMLSRLAQALIAAVGAEGVAYRIGGDEFCVVAHADPETVFARANAALSAKGDWFAIEAAYGHVRLPTEAGDVSSALQIADGRLYARKGTARRTAPQQARDALMQVLTEQDPLLSEHAARVARLAESTARRLGLDEEEVWHVRLAAELHDVGKAAVPEMLLDKPGVLDQAEWSFIKRHTLIGERIVGAAPALACVGQMIRSSHERPDGTGYPDGLSGESIPLGARIVGVADAFDAMTSDRPYARARSAEYAIGELRRCAGSQFDPRVVEAFVASATAKLAEEEATADPQVDAALDDGWRDGSGEPRPPAPVVAKMLTHATSEKRLGRALARARACHWENPQRARLVAEGVAVRALARGESALYGRALVLTAQVETRHGRLDRAFELLEAARAETKRSGEVELRAELALAESRLSFLAGLYNDALAQAQEAVALADTHRLDDLRLAARRGLTLVLGNVDDRSDELRVAAREWLELTLELGNRKEETMARNDVAYTLLLDGKLDAAREEIERAILIASQLGPPARFALAYAHGTRAEVLIAAGDPAEAVVDCERSLTLAGANEDPEPYLTAMTIHTKLRAMLASGQLELALEVGRRELDRLDQDLPHARSQILRTLSEALQQAGRTDEACSALRESAELDRATFEQLTGRQLSLQRAALEAKAARHEAQILAAKNAQLEEVLATLDEQYAAPDAA